MPESVQSCSELSIHLSVKRTSRELLLKIVRGKKYREMYGKFKTRLCVENRDKAYNEEVKFHVTQRGVREKYEGIKAKYLENIKNEEKASGISPKVTELDNLLEECGKDKLAD